MRYCLVWWRMINSIRRRYRSSLDADVASLELQRLIGFQKEAEDT